MPRRRCVEKRGTHFDGRRGRVLKEGRLAGYKAYEPRFLSYVTARGTACSSALNSTVTPDLMCTVSTCTTVGPRKMQF